MKWKISWLEWGLLIGLMVLLAAIFLLPSLSRSRESSRRSSCQNNLKQLALVVKMYANENRGNFAPPRSPIHHNWIVDAHAVYPEYLTDLAVLVCPSSPYAQNFLGRPSESPRPECVSSLFYNYTGYTISSDEQAWALFDAYNTRLPEVIQGKDFKARVPVWEGSQRNRGGAMPVFWDRPGTEPTDFSHQPLGANVAYFDGHVEFRRYHPDNGSNLFPMTRLSAETLGSVWPRMAPGCL
jgi:prepilin-type processing-associated H-X9-DG protein